tara:strand:+ start:546 stop:761 length:216 start_codon:yes stop_codon:yes gene_type:complete
MPRYRLVNNKRIQFTAEEEAAKDAEEAQAAIDKQAVIDAKTAKENNKTSGKAKLKAGEALTDAEISALFGD